MFTVKYRLSTIVAEEKYSTEVELSYQYIEYCERMNFDNYLFTFLQVKQLLFQNLDANLINTVDNAYIQFEIYVFNDMKTILFEINLASLHKMNIELKKLISKLHENLIENNENNLIVDTVNCLDYGKLKIM